MSDLLALRDLTRYRVDLLAAGTAEKNRVEKSLENALIKLAPVVSNPFEASGRAIMTALIAGERDPAAGPTRPAAACGPRPPG